MRAFNPVGAVTGGQWDHLPPRYDRYDAEQRRHIGLAYGSLPTCFQGRAPAVITRACPYCGGVNHADNCPHCGAPRGC